MISPDGRYAACHRERLTTETVSAMGELWLIDLETGDQRALGDSGYSIAWAPDSSFLYAACDDRGRRPIFEVSLDGERRRVTSDHGAYIEINVAPDGTVYALRGAVDHPPVPVKLVDGGYVTLPSPTPTSTCPAPSPR